MRIQVVLPAELAHLVDSFSVSVAKSAAPAAVSQDQKEAAAPPATFQGRTRQRVREAQGSRDTGAKRFRDTVVAELTAVVSSAWLSSREITERLTQRGICAFPETWDSEYRRRQTVKQLNKLCATGLFECVRGEYRLAAKAAEASV